MPSLQPTIFDPPCLSPILVFEKNNLHGLWPFSGRKEPRGSEWGKHKKKSIVRSGRLEELHGLFNNRRR